VQNNGEEYDSCDDLITAIGQAAQQVISGIDERMLVIAQLKIAAEASKATSVEGLIRATDVAGEDIEQELEAGKVNILTMHRAKGLTAEAVIILAAEDEYIPGRAQGDAEDDERRLLYVSLTRAKHHLYITYCDRRTGHQRHTGRTSGNTARSFTRFLRDGPLTPIDGLAFIQRQEQQT
jgi:DNA helicase-2/ATP-dependent DNA helicase PcrA